MRFFWMGFLQPKHDRQCGVLNYNFILDKKLLTLTQIDLTITCNTALSTVLE